MQFPDVVSIFMFEVCLPKILSVSDIEQGLVEVKTSFFFLLCVDFKSYHTKIFYVGIVFILMVLIFLKLYYFVLFFKIQLLYRVAD